MVKAKFRVGQVVIIKSLGSLAKIGSMNLQGRWYYWPVGSSSLGWSEEELRPLNAREMGQPRKPRSRR